VSAVHQDALVPEHKPDMVPRQAPLRLLPGVVHDPAAFDEHLARYGPLPVFRHRRERGELLGAIEASGLTGRGGAGFPTVVKLAAVLRAKRPIVVANGTEGEPASNKDKVLLSANPQLVLDGAIVAADAVGAEEIVIAVAAGDSASRARLKDALTSRRAGLRHGIKVVAVPDRFVAGEESALVQWLNGGPAKPTITPPRPFESGVRRRPTLVQNVETLANIALVARHGPEWFRRLGTPAEPGTVLVTVLGAVKRSGVLEAALGTPLSQIFARSGGLTAAPQAVLIGGYFGSWIDGRLATDVVLSEAGLRAAGASLGARTIAVLGEGTCGVAETARIARYLAGESAEQCGPCLFGLRALAETLEALTACAPEARPAVDRLPRLAGQISRRGACAHPDGAVELVASATRVFADEIDRHLAGCCSATDRRPVLPIPTGTRSWW
jgi:NADH:ubiquinone oxidoreductase subunit F (NADH-binding)